LKHEVQIPYGLTPNSEMILRWRDWSISAVRKSFFPLRVTEPWPRLPREAVESPSLEIFQPQLDKVLYNLL